MQKLDKTWLIGGGLSSPWSYADLVEMIAEPEAGEPHCVADVLIGLTRAIVRDDKIDLKTATFAGEGMRSDNRPERAEVGALKNEPRPINAERILNSKSRIQIETSGSTGTPKRIEHAVATLARGVVVNQRHQDDVWGFAYNPTHIAGVQVFLQALANRNTVVNLWGLSHTEIIDRCRQWKVTRLSATPTFYRLLLPLQEPLSEVRSISIGGEASDDELIAKLRAAFPQARLHNIYASTEAGTVLNGDGTEFTVSADRAKDVRISDGRLWLHRSLLADSLKSAEWYDTGDRVVVTANNPLKIRIVGRGEDWINIGGEKVDPAEVETVLLGHERIAAVRVYGKRNSVTGQLLVADVVFRSEPLSEADIRAYLASRMPPHKIPRIVRAVESLELTRTGKVARGSIDREDR